MPSRAKQAVAVKHETFCLLFFTEGNATKAAIGAKYSPRSARFQGSRLLKRDDIQQRLAELRQKAEDASVATVLEREQVLTEIIRGRFADFMSGGVTADKLTSAALKEIRVIEHSAGSASRKTTTISLNDPVKAIAELNRMTKVYEDGPVVAIDNRKIEITVKTPEAADLARRILGGEGTGPAEGEDTK